MDDTKRLVLTVPEGKRVNLYLDTPHGPKKLGAVKAMGDWKLCFEFTEDVRILREGKEATC